MLADCERNRQLAIAELSAKEPDPAPEEEEDAVEIVCREEKATGSRIMTTMCREQAVMDRRRERDQDMIRDVQSTPGREPLQ